jgi:exodeoxyribonuclease V alpha subunit
MNERYLNLGIATVSLRRQVAAGNADGAVEFRRRLRQIENGAAQLNLDPGAVHIAAEIAAIEPRLNDEQRLALIVLTTASLAALQEGSTRLPVVGEEARAPISRILAALCGDAFDGGADAMANAIARLLDSDLAPHIIGRAPDDYRPLIFLRPFIYHHRVRAAELRLAQLLAARLAQAPQGHDRVEAALADTMKQPGGTRAARPVLSAEQRDAVASAASHRVALISGGPGTGKTSIILAILRVLVRMGIEPKRIARAAPTGKAAFRMGESVNEGLARIEPLAGPDLLLKSAVPDPCTIHRLLGFSPSRGRFTYHRNNPLDADAVIVDEGSMLDLTLMERLAGALQSDARLIVLGDADQLPSVAAGAVFRDLVGAATAMAARNNRYRGVCTRLTHSYRMNADDRAGRTVFSFAGAINSADLSVVERTGAEPDQVRRRTRPEELDFAGVEFLSGAGFIETFLDRWYAARIGTKEIDKLSERTFAEDENGFDDSSQADLRRIFNHMAASRILCFSRVLSTGSERINASLHRRRAQAAGAAPEREFLPGEPVIVVRNDYERMLFNGDQGVIVRIRRPAGRAALMAVFRREAKFVAFHLAALRESLELCYATTIHKAQGSEFDAVAVLLPERDLPILTREALYTAVTRSRHGVAIVGEEGLIRTATSRGIERFSGLGEELTRLLS